jgi:hypothetical protein
MTNNSLSNVDKLKHFWRFWLRPIFPNINIFRLFSRYQEFLSDWKKYDQISDQPLLFENSYPCLNDATGISKFDSHYFYQAVWVTEKLIKNQPNIHFDIGSEIRFVGQLSRYLPLVFLDIRPLKANLDGLSCVAGDILTLPYGDHSIDSLSCLHVVEHIGLGRYGDCLNSEGTLLALQELKRVLRPSGDLYLSLPVGKPRVNFNAHRVHSPQKIIGCLEDLELVEFSGVKDGGVYVRNIQLSSFEDSEYACGFFHFRK